MYTVILAIITSLVVGFVLGMSSQRPPVIARAQQMIRKSDRRRTAGPAWQTRSRARTSAG